MLKENNQVIPAMVKSWVQEMLDMKQNQNARHNRYLMLEYCHRYIGQALKQYEGRQNKL